MLSSHRTGCFMDQEQEINMIHSSRFPRNHLLSRIYNEKNFFSSEMNAERKVLNNDRCLLQRDPGSLTLMSSDRLFFVASQTLLNVIIVLASLLTKNLKFWASEFVNEYNVAAYYSARHTYNQERYERM